MKTITVTGATGFVGKNLISWLKRSFAVKELNLRTQANVSFTQEDYAVVHLAGKAHDLKGTTNFEEYNQVNYELTKRMYDAFIASDVTVFIFVSSVKAVADEVSSVLDEETLPDPRTHYGKSKLTAEKYIQEQVLPPGKSYYILRPCMIHGPGNKGNLNLLYNFVKSGIPYPLAKFENRRSYLSVDNLCFVIVKLLENVAHSGVYNVADDKPLSTNDVIKTIATTLGKRPKLLGLPKSVIFVISRIGDYLKFPIDSERLHKLTSDFIVSNKKIKRALNVELPVEAEEGLILTIKSFMSKV